LAYLIRSDQLETLPLTQLRPGKLLKRARPLLFVAGIAIIMGYLDVLMLSYFYSVAAAGIYDVAIKYSSLATITLIAINAYLMPKVSRHFYTNEEKELRQKVRQSSLLILILTVPPLIFIFAAAGPLLGFYGDDFVFGGTALRILVIAQIISSISGSVAVLLQMTGNEKVFQRIFLGAFAINVALNTLLIPGFGMNGAAIATLISTSFWNIAAVIFARRKLGLMTIYFLRIKSV